ncbi:MAG: cytochrome c [Burkholderiales bacterium]
MKRILQLSTGLTLGLVVTLGAIAQVKPEVLVKQRQAVMTLQGKYFGPLFGVAQGRVPFNAAMVQRNAGLLDNLSRMAWDGFEPGTKGEKTRALPAIYDSKDRFMQYAAQLENETSKLVTVSRGGDEAAVKAQIGAVGKVCGACHDDFRSK